MDSGPDIVDGVGAWVAASTPNDEFVGMIRSFKNICVVSIQAPFQFNDANLSASKRHRVVVPILFARRMPLGNETLILKVTENYLNEIPFFAHRRGKLAANALDCSSKQTAIVKIFFVEPMSAKQVRLRLQNLSIFLDLDPKSFILLAWNAVHAAILPLNLFAFNK